jgi:hypothetical protein
MSIETICQSCGQKLRVADEHAGKKARCPQCGLIYVVPRHDEAVKPNDWGTSHEPAGAPDRWQVRTPDGRVYGPVPKQELDEWVAEGRVTTDSRLLRDDEHFWRPASELYPQLAAPTEVPLGARSTSRPFPGPAIPLPFRAETRRYQRPHRGALILILSILGWAACPVFAPFAWSMGYSDLRAMRSGTMDPRGMSLTQAGMILGLIETVFLLLLCAFLCLGAIT